MRKNDQSKPPIFKSYNNTNIIDTIMKCEENGKYEDAETTFNFAVERFSSARIWVEVGQEYRDDKKYAHAGVAYLLAAAIAYLKKMTQCIEKNYDYAANCFELAGDRIRAEDTRKKRGELLLELKANNQNRFLPGPCVMPESVRPPQPICIPKRGG